MIPKHLKHDLRSLPPLRADARYPVPVSLLNMPPAPTLGVGGGSDQGFLADWWLEVLAVLL